MELYLYINNLNFMNHLPINFFYEVFPYNSYINDEE